LREGRESGVWGKMKIYEWGMEGKRLNTQNKQKMGLLEKRAYTKHTEALACQLCIEVFGAFLPPLPKAIELVESRGVPVDEGFPGRGRWGGDKPDAGLKPRSRRVGS